MTPLAFLWTLTAKLGVSPAQFSVNKLLNVFHSYTLYSLGNNCSGEQDKNWEDSLS